MNRSPAICFDAINVQLVYIRLSVIRECYLFLIILKLKINSKMVRRFLIFLAISIILSLAITAPVKVKPQ